MSESPTPVSEASKPDPLVAAVRKLTVAVWAVAVAVFLVIGFFFAMTFGQSACSSTTTTTHSSMPPAWQPEKFEGKDFNDLTMEKKIKYASAILIVRNAKAPNGKSKWFVSEIVKVKPGTELHYKVGDDYAMPGAAVMAEQTIEGEVVLMVGSPAEMREASSFSGDRIDGTGGMTLAELREMAKKEGK